MLIVDSDWRSNVNEVFRLGLIGFWMVKEIASSRVWVEIEWHCFLCFLCYFAAIDSFIMWDCFIGESHIKLDLVILLRALAMEKLFREPQYSIVSL